MKNSVKWLTLEISNKYNIFTMWFTDSANRLEKWGNNIDKKEKNIIIVIKRIVITLFY